MGTVIDLGKRGGADQISELIQQQVHDAMKFAAEECLRQLVTLTPVDSGRLRYSYFASVNTPSSELPPAGKYQLPGISERATVESFTISDTIYIANNVYYGVYVNNGTSRIAPRYFVERAVANAQIAVNAFMKSGNG